jgi:hypothetical protein
VALGLDAIEYKQRVSVLTYGWFGLLKINLRERERERMPQVWSDTSMKNIVV